MKTFDIVIIGSGMGGLVCGSILSRMGYNICVLEKNKQIGGCLQIYVRDKVIFDAGVHYIGGLDKGQNLYQIFKWLGILDKLKLERMDQDGFDQIMLEGDDNLYPFAQGYPNFISSLARFFPEEEQAIRMYCDQIKEVCRKFPLYNLERGGTIDAKASVMATSARDLINSLTTNEKLRAVLAGNNILYAGEGDESPFYVHALILNSYIESSWKCVDGGFAIARELARTIRDHGGVIRTSSTVEKIIVENGLATAVQLTDGSQIKASQIISNLHPSKSLALTETDLIRNAYRKRLNTLKNTISVFILNIVFKPGTFPYRKCNYYFQREDSTWSMTDYNAENWPKGYAIFLAASSKSKDYAEGMTIFTYMKYEEVKAWEDTFNTTSAKKERGKEYDQFKTEKAEQLLDSVETKFPGLRNSIQSYFTATPLSFRDYIGTDDGSLYGIARNYRDPYGSMIPARTKLPNLFLTGQNLNLHGILGSAISGILTCSALLGNDEFIDNIKNA